MCEMCSTEQKIIPNSNYLAQQKKLWEIPSGYHCCIIGSCFTIEELKKILSKTKTPVPHTDFEVHHFMVGLVQKNCYESQLFNKALNKKYKETLRYYMKLTTLEELHQAWQEALKNHDLPASIWAIMSHPITDWHLLNTINNDVHILSHSLINNYHNYDTSIKQLKNQTKVLKEQIVETSTTFQDKLHQKNITIEKLHQELSEYQKLDEQYSKQSVLLEEINELKQQVQILTINLDKQAERCVEYERNIEDKQIQLDEKVELIAALETHIDTLNIEKESLENALANVMVPCVNKRNISLDLKGQTILYVGGRDNVTPHLREFIKQCNGEFIAHDGGIKDQMNQLPQWLCKADAVYCPIDCVSHNACQKIKQLCKYADKPCTFLRSSSISSFIQGIENLNKTKEYIDSCNISE